MQKLQVIDTHTGGEPTRVVYAGFPELNGEQLTEKREDFASRLDAYRRAVICEPRGSDVMVGALLLPPIHEGSVASVIFFNNVGYLGMCGHGTIGVAVALRHSGRIGNGSFKLDTPVGTVGFELLSENEVQIENVPSYRYRANVQVQLETGQTVHGDIAWGGNWFYICDDHGLEIKSSEIGSLAERTLQIRTALERQGITGANGEEIDHVELMSSTASIGDSKNYVMCPGGEYDRSPCGTGTSAKVACLAANGKLAPGEVHRQESIIGSVFEATYREYSDGKVIPSIKGTAYVNAETNMILDPNDPFAMGFE